MNKPDGIDVIRGGKPLDLTLANGQLESLFVRQVTMRQLPKYVELMALGSAKLLERLAFVVRKHNGEPVTADWLDENLTLEQFEQLEEEDKRQNFTHGEKWMKRQVQETKDSLENLKKLHPKAAEELEKRLNSITLPELSPSVLPTAEEAGMNTPSP